MRLLGIVCSLAETFAVTRRGHHVWLDDGKLGGVVKSVDPNSIELRITSAGPKGSTLRAAKGINLPDAVLDIDLLGVPQRGRPAEDPVALPSCTPAADLGHPGARSTGQDRPSVTG